LGHAVFSTLTASLGAGQLCHAPPTATPVTGGADLQGLAAYHQELGNDATLSFTATPVAGRAVFLPYGLTQERGSSVTLLQQQCLPRVALIVKA
jgi:hypothetical protein